MAAEYRSIAGTLLLKKEYGEMKGMDINYHETTIHPLGKRN